MSRIDLSKELNKNFLQALENIDANCSVALSSLHKAGVLSWALPSSYQGLEISTRDMVDLSYLLGRTSPSLFSSYTANLLGITALSRFANERLKKEVFENYLRNKTIFAFCMTEKNVGFDVASTTTLARQTADGFYLNGQKDYITNISIAEHLIVFAKTIDSQGAELGVSAFYVPRRSHLSKNTPDSISVMNEYEKLGQNHSNTAGVSFSEVWIPTENLLGNLGDGLKILSICVSRTKTLIGAAAVGAADIAVDYACKHLEKRIIKGKPLIKKPDIASCLSEISIQIEAAWLLTKQASETWDREGIAVKDSSMAKYFAAKMAVRTVSDCLELCGAEGYLETHPIASLYRASSELSIISPLIS